MEDKNSVIIGLLLVIIIILMGYICFDKVFKKEPVEDNYLDSSSTTSTTSQIKYSDFIKRVGGVFPKKINIPKDDRFPEFPINEVVLDSEGKVTVNFGKKEYIDKYGKNYVLASDILDVSVVDLGQGGLKSLVMINNSGLLVSTVTAMYNEVTLELNSNHYSAQEVISVYSRTLFDCADPNNCSGSIHVYAKSLLGQEFDITNEIK